MCEFIKEHPIVISIILILLFIIYYLYNKPCAKENYSNVERNLWEINQNSL